MSQSRDFGRPSMPRLEWFGNRTSSRRSSSISGESRFVIHGRRPPDISGLSTGVSRPGVNRLPRLVGSNQPNPLYAKDLMNMPRGGIGVALQSSRTTAHSSILGGCDHATWPMVSIEKSDATGGIQRAADRSDAAFSPAGWDHGRLDARYRTGIPTSLRLDLRINQRLPRT